MIRLKNNSKTGCNCLYFIKLRNILIKLCNIIVINMVRNKQTYQFFFFSFQIFNQEVLSESPTLPKCLTSWDSRRVSFCPERLRQSRKLGKLENCQCRCHTRFQRVFTVGTPLPLLHTVAFSKKLLILAHTNVITLETQTHALNTRRKRKFIQ